MNLFLKSKPWRRELVMSLAALLLIGGALVLTFAHVLRANPGEISGRYDIYRYYGPITFYLDYCLSQGELPLWNPLVYCGLPNAANPQAFVFYPFNLLRSLLLRAVSPQATQESIIALIGLHLLFMGFCTYLLGRAHRLSFPGSLVAALVWVCSALIVRRACEYHFLYTIAWLPLILLLVKSAIDAPALRKRLIYCLVAGLVLGVGILGGFLQIVSYLGVSIAVYALLYRVLPASAARLGSRWPGIRNISSELVAFAAIFLVGGLVAAALLLPVAELSGFSARQKGMPVPMYSDMMSWDVTRLYQSLVVFAGMKYESETLRGAGIVAMLLAIAGCFHRDRRLVALFALLAYALIDCGFGPPFPLASILHVITPFSPSAYSRGFDFALLPFGLLAGLGVDALWHGRARRPARLLLSLLLLYGAAATVGPMVYWSFPHPYLPVQKEVAVLPVLAAIAMIAILWTPRSRRIAAGLLLILPALLFAETWSWNRHYVPWMVKRDFSDAVPVAQSGHHFPTVNSRTVDPIANRALYSLTPVFNGVDPLHFADVRNLLSGSPRAEKSHRLVTDWEPTAENHRGNLLLKRFFWLARYAKHGPLPDKQEAFPAATTVYLPEGATVDIPEPPATGDYTSVSSDAIRMDIPGIDAILRRQQAGSQRSIRFPLEIPNTVGPARAGSAGAIHSTLVIRYKSGITAQVDTRFTDPATGDRHWGKRHRIRTTRNAVETLEVPLPDFPQTSVEISVTAKGGGAFSIEEVFLMADPADEDALIKILSFSANQVDLEIGPLPGPRLLTFLDAWYPGWHAYVDGQEVFVLKADDVFKAVPVPSGEHRVRFEFRPWSVAFGLGVSAAAVLLSLALIVWLARARPRPAAIPPVPDPDPKTPIDPQEPKDLQYL